MYTANRFTWVVLASCVLALANSSPSMGTSSSTRSRTGAGSAVHVAAAKPLQPIVESQHSIYAPVQATAEAQWQGTVSFDHSVTMQGTRQLRHSSRASLQLWRRICDIGGCIETDINVDAAPQPQQTWAATLATGSVAFASVAAKVTRYRVMRDDYRQIDSTVVTVPLRIDISKVSDKFQQVLVANTASVATTSVARQVNAVAAVTLGDMAVTAASAVAGSASITTIMRR